MEAKKETRRKFDFKYEKDSVLHHKKRVQRTDQGKLKTGRVARRDLFQDRVLLG